MIDGGYVDRPSAVAQLVARPTILTVPALDRRRRAHVGKAPERTEVEPVCAAGTCCRQR